MPWVSRVSEIGGDGSVDWDLAIVSKVDGTGKCEWNW